MRIAAVVVHYRFWPQVRACLDTVAAQTQPAASVVVVDDASADGSPAAIRETYPSVHVLEQQHNAGYAAAVNAGIAACPDADAVLVLSHETVLAPDALERLAAALSQERVGVVGPTLGLLDARDRTWSAGGGLGRRSSLPYHLQEPLSVAPYDVAWVDGAAFLVVRSVWEAVGGLDESYFLYVEEVDFMQRVVHAGWAVRVVPGARAWQRPGMTPPYLEARNVALWMFRTRRVRGLAVHVARQLMSAARAVRLPEQRWEAAARLRGLADACRGQLDRGVALRRPPSAE